MALEQACAAEAPGPRLQALLEELANQLLPVLEGLRNWRALTQPAGSGVPEPVRATDAG